MVAACATGCRSCRATFGNHYGRRTNAPRRCHDAKYDHNCEWGSTLYGTFWNVVLNATKSVGARSQLLSHSARDGEHEALNKLP